jgi:phosphoribosyl 1,2-cyclic phosphodiesterase
LQLRLEQAGSSWQRIRAVVLTHVHGDHCNERTLAWMQQQGIRLYCHPEHSRVLMHLSEGFCRLDVCRLVYEYELTTPFALMPGLGCVALPLAHDRFTCGFRFESAPDLFGSARALGYACDLGSWDDEVVRHLRDVDILALEFNHDVGLQQASGRPRSLIRRVLGAAGHLSNEQASELVCEILRQSQPGRLRQVVQLHLSSECNRPGLARAALQRAVGATHPLRVYAARSGRFGPRLSLSPSRPRRRMPRRLALPMDFYQPCFADFLTTASSRELELAS